ncbi:MAG TPA: hypothetical protein VN894_04840 [Polyangiaceae bacterium]|nr:hypothetical protein [Polyangiaceae bacterium]
MSLALGLLVAGGGVVIGRALAQRLRAHRATEAEPAAAKPSEAATFHAFPCRLGDVVVRTVERDEAWLAGALVFEEERPVAALFVAPEAGADRALLAREAVEGLTWLSPLPIAELALTADPPHAIEHHGVRFERVRRLPVRVTRAGSGAPSVGDRAVVAEYEGQGAERIVVVAGSERTLAWTGVALGRGEYDVLPGS